MPPELGAILAIFQFFPEDRREVETAADQMNLSEFLLMALLYGPAVRCKPDMTIWRRLVLRSRRSKRLISQA